MAIDESFQAVQLDFQSLKFDVVLITAKQDCVDAIIDQSGQGILVGRNSDSYMDDLKEVVRISNLPPASSEAQTFAMLRHIQRLSPREGDPPASASSSPTEESRLLDRERSGSRSGSTIGRRVESPGSREGSAISLSAASLASRKGSLIHQSSTASPASRSGSAVRRPTLTVTESPSGSAIDRPTTNSAQQPGSPARRSSTYSATGFSLGAKDPHDPNAKFSQPNGGDEFDGDDDETQIKARRCRWCCC
jgi:hypothetical protein